MSKTFTPTVRPSGPRCFMLACVILAALALGERQAHAQGHDALLNGAVFGAAVGAGTGVVFAHVVRDSDLGFGQYMRSALVFGAIGAGAGVGVDVLLNRRSSGPGITRRASIAPAVWRDLAAVVVMCRW